VDFARRTEVDDAIAGSYPEIARGRLDEVGIGRRETLVESKIAELVAIESGQPLARAEPEAAARIAQNAVDGIAGEPVGGSVAPDGQLIGKRRHGDERQETADRESLIAGHRW
jgi:hypothetical protein